MHKVSRYAPIFVVAILFILNETASAEVQKSKENNSSTERCASLMMSLDERFYAILFAGSVNRNDVDAALEFLKEVEKSCIASTYQRAQISDLKGEAAHLAFRYTKDREYLDIAITAYKEALALDTARNELVNWHLSRLMRTAGNFEQAFQYINKVLDMEPRPKEPLPYLTTAFQLSVDAKKWDDAKGLIQLLSKRNPRFYQDPDVLLSAVETLCHFNQLDDAKVIIKNVEDHVQLNATEREQLNLSKVTVKNCGRQSNDS